MKATRINPPPKPIFPKTEYVMVVDVEEEPAHQPKPTSEMAKARDVMQCLALFNDIMKTEVTYDELVGDGRYKMVSFAREFVSMRMRYIGRMSYPEVSRAVRNNKGKHTTIINMVDRFLSSLMRTMTDDEWAHAVRRIYEDRQT